MKAKKEKETEQPRVTRKLDTFWIDNVLNCCEQEEIPKATIERFYYSYGKQRGITSAQLSKIT